MTVILKAVVTKSEAQAAKRNHETRVVLTSPLRETGNTRLSSQWSLWRPFEDPFKMEQLFFFFLRKLFPETSGPRVDFSVPLRERNFEISQVTKCSSAQQDSKQPGFVHFHRVMALPLGLKDVNCEFQSLVWGRPWNYWWDPYSRSRAGTFFPSFQCCLLLMCAYANL